MIDNHYTNGSVYGCSMDRQMHCGLFGSYAILLFSPCHPEVREIMQRDIEVKRTDEEEVKEQEQKRQGEETEEKVEDVKEEEEEQKEDMVK